VSDAISRKNWTLIWILGLAGQICWNVENSWFNTFVYAKIAKDPAIISWMVGVSAVVATLATFLAGTWSDRIGRRKPFIVVGYIGWGLFTIAFGATEFLPREPLVLAAVFVVVFDAIMTFFGSTGNDAAFNAWTTDISTPQNRGRLGGVLAALPIFAAIFGAIVSGMLVDALDFFPFFVLMGGLVIAAGFLALFALQDHPQLVPRRSAHGFWAQLAEVFRIRTVLANRELFWVFAINCVYYIGFNVYFPYITIYMNNYLKMDYTTAGVMQGVGLLAAVCLAIPVARVIERGRSAPVIGWAVAANTVGLALISAFSNRLILLLGILGVGIGLVLVAQTSTAWFKNLCPEHQRGQFEGVRMIFNVCLPMVIGPLISRFFINRWGVYMVIDGVGGMVPTEALFAGSAAVTLLSVLPLLRAARYERARRMAA